MSVLSLCAAVNESSQVGQARRSAVEIARRLEFSETDLSNLAVIVTEAANNLVKHAKGGQLLIRALAGQRGSGLEILTIDEGPGMADVGRCLEDGYSTAGSPGTGLGAIMRMASLFDLYSQSGAGTAMVAQLWTKRYAEELRESKMDVGAVSVPMAKEKESGDGWMLVEALNHPRLMVVDGLGHGAQAAQAAAEAVRVFKQDVHEQPAALLDRAHRALAATRGAAMAVVEFDPDRRQLCFAGVGNISGRVWAKARERNFVSSHGIVGHEMHRVREYTYPWPEGSTVVLVSDGLQTRWALERYPGLHRRHPSLLAGVLYRDYQRGSDDATVVVVRERQ